MFPSFHCRVSAPVLILLSLSSCTKSKMCSVCTGLEFSAASMQTSKKLFHTDRRVSEYKCTVSEIECLTALYIKHKKKYDEFMDVKIFIPS